MSESEKKREMLIETIRSLSEERLVRVAEFTRGYNEGYADAMKKLAKK